MPRRSTPAPLAQAVGERIRELRKEAGLTLEGLAQSAGADDEFFSKGHLSNLERGLVMPTIATLNVLAEALGVLLVDLVNFPTKSERQAVIELTRHVAPGPMRRLRSDLSAVSRPRPAESKPPSRRARSKA